MKIMNGNVVLNGIITKKDIYISKEKYSLESDDSIIIDATGLYVVNGFVDIHTHGFMGFNSECSMKDLRDMAKNYISRGIFHFCPTIGPRSYEQYLKIIASYKEAFKNNNCFIGLHLEGPHLNPEKCGAIDPDTMYPIDLTKLEKFLADSKGFIKIMTIAPELHNATEAIKLLKQYGVIASIGHSTARFLETEKAIEVGATHSTHTFNAMPSFHHRNPTMIDSLLTNNGIYCEMIADQVHLSELTRDILISKKGIHKVIAVSDGGENCGYEYPNGHTFENGYKVMDQAVYSPTNVLSGSCCDLYYMARVLRKKYSMTDISRMFSENAAKSLGINTSFEINNNAHLLIVDENYRIIHNINYEQKNL